MKKPKLTTAIAFACMALVSCSKSKDVTPSNSINPLDTAHVVKISVKDYAFLDTSTQIRTNYATVTILNDTGTLKIDTLKFNVNNGIGEIHYNKQKYDTNCVVRLKLDFQFINKYYSQDEAMIKCPEQVTFSIDGVEKKLDSIIILYRAKSTHTETDYRVYDFIYNYFKLKP